MTCEKTFPLPIGPGSAMCRKTRLLASAAEQAGDMVMITDRAGIIEYVNPSFEAQTGYSAAEVLGQPAGILKSGTMPASYYRELWEGLLAGDVFRGELINRRRDGSLYHEEKTITPIRNDSGEITHFVSTGRDVTARKAMEEQLAHQASHDALTSLPNRLLLWDRIEHHIALTRRQGDGLAVVFLDIDHFKDINDSFGHPLGDRLICEAARRLTAAVRDVDTVARHGGDEFVLVLPGVGSDEHAAVIARKLLAAIAEPFRLDGHELRLTASAGIALFPRDGQNRDELLMHADAALYRAKNTGRAGYRFHWPDYSREMQERATMLAALREAVEREKLELHYQPRVDIATGRVNGMEALLRWTHPSLGAVPPDRFIPLAEGSGLIDGLGEWVLRTACRQAAAWRQAGIAMPVMAVNFSCRQFRQPDLAARIVAVLEETGLPAECLEMEITESTLMEETDRAVEVLAALRRRGVRISIDDFGTAYSSLSYLMRFPINSLKIDRSLVAEVTSNANAAVIAKTVIGLAHDLGLTVVAEGVETEEQRRFLALRYCDEMQGYYFSRPLPARMAAELLAAPPALPALPAPDNDERVLLLVDSEEGVLSSLARLFRRDGYRILRAVSAAEALELMAATPAGVVLCDQRMSGTSGIDFLRNVRRLYPNTVRMVLSGYTELNAVTEAINEGAIYKFVAKPWDDDQLRLYVREAFAHYEALAENERLKCELGVLAGLWANPQPARRLPETIVAPRAVRRAAVPVAAPPGVRLGS